MNEAREIHNFLLWNLPYLERHQIYTKEFDSVGMYPGTYKGCCHRTS